MHKAVVLAFAMTLVLASYSPLAFGSGPAQTIGVTKGVNQPTTSQGSTAPGNLELGWFALDQSNACGCTPSGTNGGGAADSNIASGDGYVFEITNGKTNVSSIGEIWNAATGSVVKSPFNLNTILYYSLGGDDAHIMYDALSGRWFITAPSQSSSHGKCSTCYIAIGVSTSSDPTSSWYHYELTSSYCSSQYAFDDPVDGVSSDKFAIDAGVACSPGGNEYFILDKAYLTSGPSGVIPSKYVYDSGPTGYANIAPVQSLTSGNTLYMVCNGCPQSTANVQAFTVTGVPSVSSVSVTKHTVSVSLSINYNTVPAPENGGATIAVYDTIYQPKFWAASGSSGDIWLPFTEYCHSSVDCIRYIEISPSSWTTVQDFDSYVSGQYFFYPVLTLDQYGDMYTEYGYSSSTSYIQVVYAGQTVFGPTGQLDWSTYLSIGPTGKITGSSPAQWGDFYGIATDPANPKLVWSVGQWVYYPSSGSPYWSTYVQSFTIGTWLQSEVSTSTTGSGHVYNPTYLVGSPDGYLAQITAANSGDSGTIEADFGTTYSGTLIVDGYSYNNGAGAYYSSVQVSVSSTGTTWTQIYNGVWNPSSSGLPSWITIGGVTNIRYVKITALDCSSGCGKPGYSSNVYIDAFDIS